MAISRHQIILDSPHFSAFASLVQHWLFSTSQTWAVWSGASAYRNITSGNSSASLLRSPLVSPGIEIFFSLYNFPDSRNTRGHISPLHVALEHDLCLACHPPNLHDTFAEEAAALCLL